MQIVGPLLVLVKYSFAFIFIKNSLYVLRGYESIDRGIRATMFLRVEIRDSARTLKIFARTTMIFQIGFNRTRLPKPSAKDTRIVDTVSRARLKDLR